MKLKLATLIAIAAVIAASEGLPMDTNAVVATTTTNQTVTVTIEWPRFHDTKVKIVVTGLKSEDAPAVVEKAMTQIKEILSTEATMEERRYSRHNR